MERRKSERSIAVIDWDGNFFFLNSCLYRRLGSKSLRVMHQNFFDLIAREEEENLRQAMSCSVLTDSRPKANTHFRTENSRPVTWQVVCIGKRAGSVDLFLLKEMGAKPIRREPVNRLAAAVVEAREQERTRIGLELHDNVNQILFTCKLYLDLIKPVLPEHIEIKQRTVAFLLTAIEEIRMLSKDLVVTPLKENGLVFCIARLLDELRVTDLFKINFSVGKEELIESMNERLKVTLFRIVQEQLKNVIKYSRAQQVDIELSTMGKEVRLMIADDGVGFNVATVRKGIGLSSIRERAKVYDGHAAIKTRPGHGCRITVVIPFRSD